jgi:integrase/recombinase XerD
MRDMMYEFIEEAGRKGFKEKTLSDYRRKLAFFFDFLEENYPDVREITGITSGIVRSYEKQLALKRDRKEQLISNSRRGKYLSTLKSFFAWLQREERIYRSPASNVALPRERKPVIKDVLTAEEMERLLQSVSGDSMRDIRDRAVMELLYSTGIRSDELCNIRMDDIDLNERVLFVRKGKLDKERYVPFGERAKQWVERYIEKVRPHVADNDVPEIFVAFLRRGKMSTSALYDLIKYRAELSGIEKNITTHTFRHSCAIHMLKGRADIRYVQKQLGHRSIQSTEKYLKIEITDLKEVHERTHPREQEDW